MVVTQNGGPNEYVRHEVDGLKIHPTVDSVVWGLHTMMADADRARWMGRNGRRCVESTFTWDTIAGQTAGVYEGLCVPTRAVAAEAPRSVRAEPPARPRRRKRRQMVQAAS